MSEEAKDVEMSDAAAVRSEGGIIRIALANVRHPHVRRGGGGDGDCCPPVLLYWYPI